MAVLVAVHVDPLYYEPHQLAALFERLLGVGFDLFDALPERQEPRLGGLCRQLVLFFPGDIGLDGGDQEFEVLHLVLEVRQVDFPAASSALAPGRCALSSAWLGLNLAHMG